MQDLLWAKEISIVFPMPASSQQEVIDRERDRFLFQTCSLLSPQISLTQYDRWLISIIFVCLLFDNVGLSCLGNPRSHHIGDYQTLCELQRGGRLQGAEQGDEGTRHWWNCYYSNTFCSLERTTPRNQNTLQENARKGCSFFSSCLVFSIDCFVLFFFHLLDFIKEDCFQFHFHRISSLICRTCSSTWSPRPPVTFSMPFWLSCKRQPSSTRASCVGRWRAWAPTRPPWWRFSLPGRTLKSLPSRLPLPYVRVSLTSQTYSKHASLFKRIRTTVSMLPFCVSSVSRSRSCSRSRIGDERRFHAPAYCSSWRMRCLCFM